MGTGCDDIFAHSCDGRPESEWQRLTDHLYGTASLAERFAAAFESADWGRLAGLWHDPGKAQPEFQEKLRGLPRQVDHSVVGALLAKLKGPKRYVPLAFVIAGHHGGLTNLVSSEAAATPLLERLRERERLLEETVPRIPQAIREQPLPDLPSFLQRRARITASDSAYRRRMEFWIRFLYSALVDADFLDTEEFYRPGVRGAAIAGYDSIASLRSRLDAYVADLVAGSEPGKVNRLRAEILKSCCDAAPQPQGIFSLSVPTGGGKTLSSMAFALRHAEKHRLQRVIAVIPYTSIIEQNAAVYGRALGIRNVIEHHSNLDPATETPRNRLASENWDAPVIVTTAVQFFESLFANRPARCRKLHNIAQSVLLLDEAQSLPSGFLDPILEALSELVANYRCSVVLSTATQPALKHREALPGGFAEITEIIPDPALLSRQLVRVGVEWPDLKAPPVEWQDLADDLAEYDQVLAVVHRRDDARILATLLPEGGTYHLSALMCAKHRLKVINQVRDGLKTGQTCRLVSTQLIEAGVDVDFPVVYRALAGLDNVVQAAGRCNREGRLDRGRVVAFKAPTTPPRGTPTKGLEATMSMLRQYPRGPDPHSPAICEEYFRGLYARLEKDTKNIQRQRQEFNFALTAAKFRLIDDAQSTPVVVPYADSKSRVDACRRNLTRENLRALQPFLVTIYEPDLRLLEQAGAIELVGDVVRNLTDSFAHLYDKRFGLCVGANPQPDPGQMIV